VTMPATNINNAAGPRSSWSPPTGV
jgi:hypothetical protein